MLIRLAIAALAALGIAAPSASAVERVEVQGNRLVDQAGQPLRLLGVNRAALESACTYGGVSDGPLHAASVDAMLTWKLNTVRVAVNADCWLGRDGLPVEASGTAAEYRTRVASYVALLRSRGLIVVLEPHFAGPGALPGKYLAPMADENIAAFWADAAARFKGDRGIVFDLFNEPHPGGYGGDIVDGRTPWQCVRDGCRVRFTEVNPAVEYDGVGMQALLNAVRGAGAQNVVLAAGPSYAGDLSEWLAHRPNDPAGQTAASLHIYEFTPGSPLGSEARERPADGAETPAQSAANRVTAWNEFVKPVAQHVPVVTGELGEYDCTHDFTDQYMAWADANGVSYLAWTWNATDRDPVSQDGFGGDGADDGYWFCDGRHDLGRGGPALITRFDGTPTPFGQGVRAHLAGLAAGVTPPPPPPPPATTVTTSRTGSTAIRISAARTVKRTARRVRLRVAAPPGSRLAVSLRLGGSTIARRALTARAGAFSVTLPRRARAKLRRSRGRALVARVTIRPPAGAAITRTHRLRITR